MAEPEAKQPDFYVGDTELRPREFEGPPRNPDGTFAKVEPTPEVPATPPPAPTHTSWLIGQAKDFGFSDQEIAETPTDELGRSVTRLAKQERAFRQEQGVARTVADKQVRQPDPEPDPEIDWGMDEDGKPISADDLLPGIRNAIVASHKKAEQLERRLAEIDARENQRERASTAERLDAAFDVLSPIYGTILGKGPARELGDGLEYRARMEILQRTGKKSLHDITAKDIAKAAAEFVADARKYAELAGPAAPSAPAKSAIPVEEWNDAALARPTSRRGAAEPNGDAKAVRNLEKRLAESDKVGSSGDREIFDTLLK